MYYTAMNTLEMVGTKKEVAQVAVKAGSTRVTVTLEPKIYKKLKLASEREHRTLSGQIRFELAKLLANESGKSKDGGKRG